MPEKDGFEEILTPDDPEGEEVGPVKRRHRRTNAQIEADGEGPKGHTGKWRTEGKGQEKESKPKAHKVDPELESKEALMVLRVPRDWLGRPMTPEEESFHGRTVEGYSRRYNVEPSLILLHLRAAISGIWYAGIAIGAVLDWYKGRKEAKGKLIDAKASAVYGSVGMGKNGPGGTGNSNPPGPVQGPDSNTLSR